MTYFHFTNNLLWWVDNPPIWILHYRLFTKLPEKKKSSWRSPLMQLPLHGSRQVWMCWGKHYVIFFIDPAYFFYIYHLQEDLESALEAIKTGTPVQKAASEFGIPSGTLYGRCKKVGIELSKNAAVHWSEEAMKKALASYQTGGMSINQAAIHYNLPYSSLYGRINRWKRENGEEALIENRLVLQRVPWPADLKRNND